MLAVGTRFHVAGVALLELGHTRVHVAFRPPIGSDAAINPKKVGLHVWRIEQFKVVKW
jgi:hypothetical protein